MDAIDAVLDGPRARGAFLLKAVFSGSWSIGIEDRSPLAILVMVRGRATLRAPGDDPQAPRGPSASEVLSGGDVVVLREPAPYVVADSAETEVSVRILPGQVCVDPEGRLLAEEMSLGVRTWGNARLHGRDAAREVDEATGADETTVMLIGTYERETSVGALLLSRLPTVSVLHGLDSPLVGLLATELVKDRPGQTAVLDRLLDLLVVTCLRDAIEASAGPGSDPVVDHAVRALEEHPERPWTVQSLADLVGLSRAALARRFTAQVGDPPLTYLTRWRLALAADLVAGTDLTLAAVAARVGYANAFALSTAFKRAYGVPPARFRADRSA